jgi:hypothetical protein
VQAWRESLRRLVHVHTTAGDLAEAQEMSRQYRELGDGLEPGELESIFDHYHQR